MVGQSEYSLMPSRSSASSRTLKAANLSGLTPCMPRILMTVAEKPHWGVSGVPFMKSTTGADATALSMAERVAFERRRACEGVRGEMGARKEMGARTAGRTARRSKLWRGAEVSHGGRKGTLGGSCQRWLVYVQTQRFGKTCRPIVLTWEGVLFRDGAGDEGEVLLRAEKWAKSCPAGTCH
ncbi:hypothetical protein E5D57_008096 [Metarhizium anisopliae]|nr:hypothetical protein E5D57_008096 [Metarhizium anisopliae]